MLGGANFPSEDNLLHAPDGVSFAELLERDWSLLCSVILVVRSEEFVDGAKEVSRHMLSFGWTYLDYTDEVI